MGRRGFTPSISCGTPALRWRSPPWHGAGRTMRARSLRDCCSPYIPCTWRRWRTSWAGRSSWPHCSRCSPCTRASCARALAGARRRWAWASSPRKTPRSRRRSSLSRGCSAWRGRSAVARAIVRHPFAAYESIAPMFVGESPLTVRLTALYGLTDVARLLVFPLTLRVDYSPAERTVVTTPLDPRFLAGLACALIWGALLWLAWKGGRKLEAFGLGWIGLALLPVANLLYPAGFYLAERTLYLPSVGLVIAAAAWLGRLPRAAVRPVVAALVVLGGFRTALRVSVWRDDAHVTRSVLRDSPRSYVGHKRMIGLFLDRRQPALALDAARVAARLYPRDAGTYVTGSVAAFAAGEVRAADSLLTGLERLCHGGCSGYYRSEAAVAREIGRASC